MSKIIKLNNKNWVPTTPIVPLAGHGYSALGYLLPGDPPKIAILSWNKKKTVFDKFIDLFTGQLRFK